jgi:Tol biopolymer transport system component
MTIKTQRYFLIVLLSLLTACGQVTPPATETPTIPAPPSVETLIPLLTFTPETLGSPLPFPTLPNLPTPTVAPTRTPLPAVLPKFPLDGYVMLFAKDGDLYFQDGENTPIKLTHVGEEHAAILSDDGKKVVFFQQNYRDIYSINTDGSHEQLLVKDRSLAEYTGRYSQFVPNTHILLFNTYQCEKQGEITLCATGVSSVDTDTAEIKELAKPDKVGLYTTLSNYSASPDGKMITVEYPGYIDILDVNGKAIRRNVLPYTPSLPSYGGIPLLPSPFWLPDSSGLIVIVPDGVTFVGGYDVPAYSVWQYDINTTAATRISLTPSLVYIPGGYVCGEYTVSPDRKWILYLGSEDYTQSLSGGGDYAFYVRNLQNEQAQRYDIGFCTENSWSPDSEHFLYGNTLNAIGKPSIEIKPPNIIGWVDGFHFILPDGNPKSSEMKVLVAEIREDTVVFFDSGIRFFDLVTIKPKR